MSENLRGQEISEVDQIGAKRANSAPELGSDAAVPILLPKRGKLLPKKNWLEANSVRMAQLECRMTHKHGMCEYCAIKVE